MSEYDCSHVPSAVGRGIALTSLLLALALVATALRMYTRKAITKAMWYDDAAMAIATLLAVPYFALNLVLFALGCGRHSRCVSQTQQEQAVNIVGPSILLALISLIFSRASVALLLYRLFPVVKWIKPVLISLTALMTAFSISSGVLFFHASPSAPKADVSLTYTSSAVFTLSDLALAIVPAFILARLQMSLKQKVEATVMLALGLVTAAAALAKLVSVKQVQRADSDWMHSNVNTIFFQELECAVAILAGSMPAIKPLFKQRKKSLAASPETHVTRAHPPKRYTKLRQQSFDESAAEALHVPPSAKL